MCTSLSFNHYGLKTKSKMVKFDLAMREFQIKQYCCCLSTKGVE